MKKVYDREPATPEQALEYLKKRREEEKDPKHKQEAKMKASSLRTKIWKEKQLEKLNKKTSNGLIKPRENFPEYSREEEKHQVFRDLN